VPAPVFPSLSHLHKIARSKGNPMPFSTLSRHRTLTILGNGLFGGALSAVVTEADLVRGVA